MKLSIVVIAYQMRREVPRTVQSLCAPYQRGVSGHDYEIIVVDNGSADPIRLTDLPTSDGRVRLIQHETSSPSPVDAVNLGVQEARGRFVAVIVDGARMASPGVVARSLEQLEQDPCAVAIVPAWHLGPDVQHRSIRSGYDQSVEDELLDASEWTSDGYRLFGVSTLAPSSKPCVDGELPTEFSWFAIDRDRFVKLGGFDVRFQSSGGGLCNQEFRNRIVTQTSTTSVLIRSEGVFHQVHGGVTTNAPPEDRPIARFHAEFEALTGRRFTPATPNSLEVIGQLPNGARSSE